MVRNLGHLHGLSRGAGQGIHPCVAICGACILPHLCGLPEDSWGRRALSRAVVAAVRGSYQSVLAGCPGGGELTQSIQVSRCPAGAWRTSCGGEGQEESMSFYHIGKGLH